MQEEKLDLDVIRTDGGTQPRAGLVAEVVRDYAEAITEGARMPPLVVYHDGESWWLADGFHRLAAYREIGMREVPAEVRTGTRRDAILCAAGANARHGLRRSNADKRRAVEMLLRDEEWSRWSDREIARRCAVSHEFVRRLRASICQPLTDSADSGGRRVRRGGAVYEQNTGPIGKSRKPSAEDGDATLSEQDGKPAPGDDSANEDTGTPAPEAAGPDETSTSPGRKDNNDATGNGEEEPHPPGRDIEPSEAELLRKHLAEREAEVASLEAIVAELRTENESLRRTLEMNADEHVKELEMRLEDLIRHNRVLESRVQSLVEEKAEAVKTARYWERRARSAGRASPRSGDRVASV